ncbi:MAG: glycerol-3-phosphate acyltransferase [Chloroflexaceae bacterium]|nr:glycerol-3-phosphate acyltransferase [Chloroflexaceae bacterium]
MLIPTTLGLMVVAYLLGSVPFSFIVARFCGVDLRTVGSGNIGAANVWRSCGFVPFVTAMVLDMLKGFVLPFVAIIYLKIPALSVIAISASVMLGHTFSIYIGFKGGKAVATGAGVILAIFPPAMISGMIAWIGAFALTRISAVSSLSAAAATTIVVLIGMTQGYLEVVYAVFTCIGTSIIIVLHRSNIARMIAGTENRFQKPS